LQLPSPWTLALALTLTLSVGLSLGLGVGAEMEQRLRRSMAKVRELKRKVAQREAEERQYDKDPLWRGEKTRPTPQDLQPQTLQQRKVCLRPLPLSASLVGVCRIKGVLLLRVPPPAARLLIAHARLASRRSVAPSRW
jgi:hypothetical protein